MALYLHNMALYLRQAAGRSFKPPESLLDPPVEKHRGLFSF
jgi:hypothetical protein